MKRSRWNLASRLSARALLAFGLGAILVCALLVADLVGLVPDRAKAVREGRAALAESAALTAAVLVARGDDAAIGTYLGALQARHAALRFVQVRSADGGFVATAGAGAAPETPAAPVASEASTATPQAAVAPSDIDRIVVPVLAGAQAWGQVELRFAPHTRLAGWAPWLPQTAPLALALGLACTLAFHLYLRRMLRHLDPSNAIPARVRTAFDTLAEGLLVLDPAGDIVLANRAFASVAGLAPEALIGRNAALLPWQARADTAPATPGGPAPAGAAPSRLPWLDTLADGRLRQGTLMSLPDAAGAHRSFRVNCSPIAGPTGPSGVLVSLDDITALEEQELELRLARDAAQAANRAKSDFLANMSHEIRTPMNAILGFAELLRRGSVRKPDEARKYLDIIHGSGRHLLALINDILDLSKVEAGHLEVEALPCAAHEVVIEASRVMALKAAEKGLALALDLRAPLPALVATDAGRLRQIVTNLLGNAIKFTQAGSVTVSVSVQADAARSQGLLWVDVRDTGIGIAPHRLESIFEPFVQAESSTTRRFGGTGLGLTISRRFARALGGDILASSQPGRGSLFRLSVQTGPLAHTAWLDAPALQALQNDNASTAPAAAAWRFAPHKVLVVDDGEENRELVRVLLEEAGLEVLEAGDGQQALALVARQQPALVLMDMQMPVMDGSTATRRLRERGHTLPIVALTANAMKGFEAEIQAAGFSGHLTKPVDIDALMAMLARWLGGERVAPATPEPAGVLAGLGLRVVGSASPEHGDIRESRASQEGPARPASQAAPLAPVHSRLATHPRLAKVARSFCAQLPAKLDAMDAALQQADFETLAFEAHWLKGAGGSVGYDDFFEPARRLEEAARGCDIEASAAQLARLAELAQRTVAPPEAQSSSASPAQAPAPASPLNPPPPVAGNSPARQAAPA